jgi:predicted RNase H-like HicB family nuclease
MYRVGYPGWTLVGRFVPLLFRVEIIRDEEAGVFIATSPDVRGLVAEAPSLDELFKEVHEGADVLIAEKMRKPAARAVVAWDGAICPA